MDINFYIPDDIAAKLNVTAGNLGRRALETLALEEYKNKQITSKELREILGFETRYQLDGFLKAHNVFYDYTLADFELEQKALKDLGF